MPSKSGRFSGGIAAGSSPPIAIAGPTDRNHWTLEESILKSTMKKSEEPVIDLQSDHYFMGEALRQAARALCRGGNARRRGHRAARADYCARV